MFGAELFDPDQWADLFKKSGAKCRWSYVETAHKGVCNVYSTINLKLHLFPFPPPHPSPSPPLPSDVVLTSKHHEGWCNFKGSYHWNWNSVDLGPKRDLVGDLTQSVRAAGLHMGLYHSLREWYNPLYLQVN